MKNGGWEQEALRLAPAGHVFGAAELLRLLLAKLFLTALCFGFGFAGGVFSPALLIGTITDSTPACGDVGSGLEDDRP